MGDMASDAHLKILEDWMKSYRPEELFDANGRLIPELAELAPKGTRRMGDNPHTNGGVILRDLRMPDFKDYAVTVERAGATTGEATRVLGYFLRDVMRENMDSRNFRVVGPDETQSNRLGGLFEVTKRSWDAQKLPIDEPDGYLDIHGRVLEILSE